MMATKNLHILLDIDAYEKLRHLSFLTNKPRSELAREAISVLLKKAQRQGKIPSNINISTPTC